MQKVPKPGNDMGGRMTVSTGTPIRASWLTSRAPMSSRTKPGSTPTIHVADCVVSVAWLPPPAAGSAGWIEKVRVPMRFELGPGGGGGLRSYGSWPGRVAGIQCPGNGK